MQGAGTSVRPQSLKWKEEKWDGAWQFGHEARECFRRPTHDVVERGAADQPYQRDNGECSEQGALRECISCSQDRCPAPKGVSNFESNLQTHEHCKQPKAKLLWLVIRFLTVSESCPDAPHHQTCKAVRTDFTPELKWRDYREAN